MALPEAPTFRVDGKRALVTGGGRGIGLAAATALANAGAHVTLLARTLDEIEASAAAICERGGEAQALALDICDLNAVAEAVRNSEAFDILVNNAGTNRPAALVDMSVAEFDFVMNLNVRAAYFVTQAVVRRLIETDRPGSIINISSQMAFVGGVGRTVYCASKAAIEGLTRAMAIELGPRRIRINSLCPTVTETPLMESILAEETFRANALSRIALGRLGQVEDLMGAIVFLASDASIMMTGSSLIVDGGWTAG